MTGLREAFSGVRDALESAGVKFAVGGSWASTTYGEPRQTNDIDIVASFSISTLPTFLDFLGDGFYFDADTAREAFLLGRAFNVIHRQWSFKFDFFPVQDEHGAAELGRVVEVDIPALSERPVPVVSAEDIIVAKLRWYREGGSVSEQQWRDIAGVLRAEGGRLDWDYLELWARKLGLSGLLEKVSTEVSGADERT